MTSSACVVHIVRRVEGLIAWRVPAAQSTDQSSRVSKCLSRGKSCEGDPEEEEEEEGSGQTVFDPTGIELPHRSGTVSAELRELLLDEQYSQT